MLLNPKSRMGNQVIGVGNAVSPGHVISPSVRMGHKIALMIRMSISHATNLSPQKASVSCVVGCFWTGVLHFGQYVALSESLFPHFWQYGMVYFTGRIVVLVWGIYCVLPCGCVRIISGC